MTGPATPKPAASIARAPRSFVSARVSDRNFEITSSKLGNARLSYRCLMIFLWVLSSTSNSAKLHFVPPMSPARTTRLPPPTASCACGLRLRSAFLMRDGREQGRSRLIDEKEFLPIVPRLHKLRGIGRVWLSLQDIVQDFRLFGPNSQEAHAHRRVEHRQRQRHSSHIQLCDHGSADPARGLACHTCARKQGRGVAVFTQAEKNQVKSRETAVIEFQVVAQHFLVFVSRPADIRFLGFHAVNICLWK